MASFLSRRRRRLFATALNPGHAVQLLECGAEYFPALIHAIGAATYRVHLETYIFDFAGDGERVAAALEQAASRGLEVRVLMDGIGTPQVPPKWIQRWLTAGVQWSRFAPLDTWGLLRPRHWRRLHRKLCVVDSHVGFCGGINVLDDHLDPNHGPQVEPRLDYALCITGPVVPHMEEVMTRLWVRLQATQALEHLRFAEARRWLKPALLTPTGAGAHAQLPALAVGNLAGDWHQDVPAALVLRDNVRNRQAIERCYLRAIGTARAEVLIANAYFLPGLRLQRALVLAARRGVRVRLLLQGRYEYFWQYHGTRAVLGTLLAAGVEVRTVSAAFLHAKVAVVDGHWATVGSSNLDPLSLLLAREANVVVDHTGFAIQLRERLLWRWEQEGEALDAAAFDRIPPLERARDWLAYGLLRAALWLTGWRY